MSRGWGGLKPEGDVGFWENEEQFFAENLSVREKACEFIFPQESYFVDQGIDLFGGGFFDPAINGKAAQQLFLERFG